MKRTLIVLMLYLLLFGVLFVIAAYDYFNRISIVDIGFSASITNLLIVVLSGVGLLKTLWHIYAF